MNPNERPIHCSNKNKRQFYIKDKDEWNQDKNNNKINKTILIIEQAFALFQALVCACEPMGLISDTLN